eukprot:scaffold29123_cov37-Attheya_sp.AAC.1
MGSDPIQCISSILCEACLHCGSTHSFEDVIRYYMGARAHITEWGRVRHPFPVRMLATRRAKHLTGQNHPGTDV